MDINKIAWLTDIHLNFLAAKARSEFYKSVVATKVDAIVITGDIAEAKDICEILSEFSLSFNKPIFFVLGNHDYYTSSVSSVREKIVALCSQNNKLIWLGKPEIIKINNHTSLVGQDSWADARYGDFDHSSITLNDSRYIAELFQAFLLNKSALKNEMQKLADRDAEILGKTLNRAINQSQTKIIIAIHVPPFAECSWHKDKPSDENWLPYFASRATGDVIASIAKKHPRIEFLVLCGHTHTRNITKISTNLEVRAGNAEYYHPEIQDVIWNSLDLM